MSEHFHVETERLRASQEFQDRARLAVSELACHVRGAATTGNAFGHVGSDAEASYHAWVEHEATGLEQLSRMLGDLAAGLEHCADMYDGVDSHNASGMSTMRGKLG